MRTRVWAVVLASTVLLSGCGWFGPPGEPHVAPGPRLVDAPYACPTIGHTIVSTQGASTLPLGALAARLCVTQRPGPFLPPHDDLTSHLDRLVRLVNRQRITGTVQPVTARMLNTGCGGPTPPGFAIVLRYPGGTRTITGNALPCQGVPLQVGNGVRDHSMRVWHAYLRLLARQRRHQPAHPIPASRPERSCPHARTGYAVTPLFDVHTLVGARVCPVDRNNHPIDHAVRRLGRADLPLLRTDLRTRRSRRVGSGGPNCHRWPATEHYRVVAVDTWGDRMVLSGLCDTFDRETAVESFTGVRTVRPLPATARLIVRLLGG